jgi:hypothetical protein
MTQRTRTVRPLAVALLAAMPALVSNPALSTPRPEVASACDGTWDQVPSPPQGGSLSGVEAVSPEDVWAVGSGMYFSTALTTRWDGERWSVVRNPADGWIYSSLRGVSAASPTDVWAVGSHSEEGVTSPLAMHWDGERWRRVRTPQPPGTWRELLDVSAVGPDDVWAVGDMGSPAALIMHWDGTTWTLIPSPPLEDGFRRLYSVSAVASDDVWAAGWQFASGKGSANPH